MLVGLRNIYASIIIKTIMAKNLVLEVVNINRNNIYIEIALIE